MVSNFLVCVGGTGARCLEAMLYQAASGMFEPVIGESSIRVLLVDPDQNNGNVANVRTLFGTYHRLAAEKQPSILRRRLLWLGSRSLPKPSLFQTGFEPAGESDFFWSNPNLAGRVVKDAIGYREQRREFRDFLSLFFAEEDLEIGLDQGFVARANLGSVGLDLYLRETLGQGALASFMASLRSALVSGEARLCVVASLFGGTGAAALQTIPSFLQGLDAEVLGRQRERLRYGAVMLGPYFSFPRPEGETGPDSDRHIANSQAALAYYGNTVPAYQHVWLIGAPEQHATAGENVPSGERQRNAPHYAEFVAGLAALDFFGLPSINANDKLLHYADDMVRVNGGTQSVGLTWQTLPLPNRLRDEARKRLTSFTTLAYFYTQYLHDAIVQRQDHSRWAWCRDNFDVVSQLDAHRAELEIFNGFLSGYLRWLRQIGASASTRPGKLFQWSAFDVTKPASDAYLGSLLADEVHPRYASEAYHELMTRLNGLTLTQRTGTPIGRLMYLLHRAVTEFCEANYRFGH